MTRAARANLVQVFAGLAFVVAGLAMADTEDLIVIAAAALGVLIAVGLTLIPVEINRPRGRRRTPREITAVGWALAAAATAIGLVLLGAQSTSFAIVGFVWIAIGAGSLVRARRTAPSH